VPLTDAEVKNAKLESVPRDLADGGGLYVAASRAKALRRKYRFDPKEKLLTVGRYPEISLSEARDRRDVGQPHPRAPCIQRPS
jgi:hypothetical protein